MDWTFIVSIVFGVIVTGLASAIGWLFHTVGANKVSTAELKTQLDSKLDKDAAAEKYVTRDSYVPRITILNQKLDGMADMLARVDERSRRWEEDRSS